MTHITDQPIPHKIDNCNTCFGVLGTSSCLFPTKKNEKFLATLDANGNIIDLCCEQCQQELMDSQEDMDNCF